MPGNVRILVMALALAVAILLATLTAVTAAIITRLGGGPLSSAILRGGVTFGGTLTLLLAVMTTIAAFLS